MSVTSLASVTAEQTRDLLGLGVLMFKLSAGARYLAVLRELLPAAGSVPGLAQLLQGIEPYRAVYPDSESPAQYAASLLGVIGIADNALANAFVIGQRQAGAGKGDIAVAVLSFLVDGDDAMFAQRISPFGNGDQAALLTARQVLQNKIEVATYFSVALAVAQTDFVVLQGTLSGVGATAASVSAAKAAIDAALVSPPTLEAPAARVYVDTPANDRFDIAQGQLVGSDPDLTPVRFGIVGASTLPSGGNFDLGRQGSFGSLLLNSLTGAYSFEPLNAAIQGLKVDGGEAFQVFASDGRLRTERELAIVVRAANDPAAIGGVLLGAVSEDAAPPQAAGALTVADRDNGDDRVVAQLNQPGALGTFSITAAGAWTYALNNAAAQALRAGQGMAETFPVRSIDGTAVVNVTVNVTGVNDTPNFGGVATGAVSEDAVLAAAGALTIVDADGGESSFVAQAARAVNLGLFSITATGAWNFALDNAAAQALQAGEVVNVVIPVGSVDGTATQVRVAVSGANDPATLTGGASGSYLALSTTVGGVGAEGLLTVADPDAGESAVRVISRQQGTFGQFSVDAAGRWRYFPDNGPATEALPQGGTGTDRFVVASADGTATQAVVITVTGRNEAPVARPDAYALLQGGTLTLAAAQGVLANDSDVDTGATLAAALVSGVSNGTLQLRSDGGLVYTPAPTFVGIDRFSYTANDGITGSAVVEVTLNVAAAPSPVSLNSLATGSGSGGGSITGTSAGLRVGLALDGVGDFNLDGFDDYAFSAGNKVYVGYGNSAGSPPTLAQLDAGVGGLRINIDVPYLPGQRLLVAGLGDVNRDGRSDFAISLPDAQAAPGSAAGLAFFVFGRPSTSAVSLNSLLNPTPGGGGFGLWGSAAGTNLGVSVSSGDINGDGITDILVGATGLRNGSGVATGGATVIFGGTALNTQGGAAVSTVAQAGRGFDVFGASAGSSAGAAVAAGDLDGDGKDDLLIGAPQASGGLGQVYWVAGRSGSTAVNLASPGTAAGVFAVGLAAGAGFGHALDVLPADAAAAAGRSPMVFVGAPFASNNSGAVYGLPVTGALNANEVPNVASPPAGAMVFTGQQAGSYTGIDVAIGPTLIGGPEPTLMFNAPGFNTPGATNAGALFVVPLLDPRQPYLGTNVPAPSAQTPALLGASPFITAPGFVYLAGSPFGYAFENSFGVGDWNSDGLLDLLGAEYGYDGGGTDVGRVVFDLGRKSLNSPVSVSTSTDGAFPGRTTAHGTSMNDTFVVSPMFWPGRGLALGDRFSGGAGDDTFLLDPQSSLSGSWILGGLGLDTLQLRGKQAPRDLRALGQSEVLKVDRIDLAGQGNALVIDALTTELIGARENFRAANGWAGTDEERVQLLVVGSNGDTVSLKGNDWFLSGNASKDGQNYAVFHSTSKPDVELIAQVTVDVIFGVP